MDGRNENKELGNERKTLDWHVISMPGAERTMEYHPPTFPLTLSALALAE